MDANTYQQEAKRTLIDAPDREIPANEIQMVWAALQIAIAAGKLVESLKKAVFHQHGVDYQVFADSLVRIADLAALQDQVPAPALTDEEVMKLWNLTGLIGEAAEIGETITEDLANDSIPFHSPAHSLTKELGDAQWYIAALATKYNLSLNDILITNVEKLQRRYLNGYSAEASKNRSEE